jgi:hypothetical protein
MPKIERFCFSTENNFDNISLKLFNPRFQFCIMNKAQGGAIGGGIATAIIIGVILTIFASEGSISSDQPEISENVMIDEGGPGGDSVAINESYTVNKGVEYFTDEEGRKTYVINASDSPELGD